MTQTAPTAPGLPQNDSVSTTRGATVAEWCPWLVLPAMATGLVSAGLALGLTDPEGNWIEGEAWVNIPLAVGFSTVAAGIWATRPHPVGVLRLGVLYTVVGIAASVVLPTYGVARLDVVGAEASAWVSNWVWTLSAAPLFGLGLVLYPDGRLPSRRWWPAVLFGVAAPVLMALDMALIPGPLENHPHVDNPFGIGSRSFWDAVGGGGLVLLIIAAVLGLCALVVKFRRAPVGGDVRGQIRGFLIAGAVVVVVASLPADDQAMTLLGVVAVTALPVTVGIAVIRHRMLDQRADVAALRQRVGALAESRRHLVSEREEERARLRRDLHDGLGPSLAAIGLGLRQFEQNSDDGSISVLADEVQRAVAEVRRICEGLRPAALDELGLPSALAEALEPLERFGPQITLTVGDLPPLAPAAEVAAFRIVMEAATNAVRHAQAERIEVTVAYDDGLVLGVDDDGAGLPPDFQPGVGLKGMSERADEVGGWMSARTSATHGTQVRAWLPGAGHG